jgi:hypothetical protein
MRLTCWIAVLTLGVLASGRPLFSEDGGGSALAFPSLKDILPRSGELAGWAISQGPTLYTGDHIFDYMDGAGEIPRGYGFRGLCTANYFKSNSSVEITLFEMQDDGAAFGYFSVRDRTAGGRSIKLENDARIIAKYGLITWKDKYTILVLINDGSLGDDLLVQFARRVTRKIRARGKTPDLMRYLPPEHMISNSGQYIRGKAAFDAEVKFVAEDIFALKKGSVDVAKGDYRKTIDSYSFVLLRYQSPEDAVKASKAFASYLSTVARGEDPIVGSKQPQAYVDSPSPSTGFWTGLDPVDKFIGAFQSRQYLGLVLRAKDKETALSMLKIFKKRVIG